MNILNILQCTNLGGMEQASLRLMEGLQARQHHCRVISLNPIAALGPLLAEKGIPAIGLTYRGPAGMLSLPAFKRCLKSYRSETDALMMTGHNLMAMLGLGSFCRGHRVLAMHFHHRGVKSDHTWRLIYRLAERQFQAITYPSDFIRLEAESIYPPIAKITHTVRLPIIIPTLPDNEAAVRARERLGLQQEIPVIGNAGWLIPRKRWDVFLQVAQKIKQSVPEAVFVIAGDGPLRGELENQADALGLKNNLRWLGWCKDMADFYRSIDLLLFNTDWDAFPVTPQEAMTYGRPVVASAINSGLKELFSAFTPGVFFHEHNISGLAEAAIDLLNHPDRAAGCSLAGRDGMRRMGNPEAIVQTYEQLLRR